VTTVSAEAAEGTPGSSRWLLLRVALAALLGLLSPFVPKLSMPALLIALLVYLVLPRAAPPALRWLLIGAFALAAIGAVRFVVAEAVPGMVQGGKAATQQRAVSRLREVVFAEDSLRKLATVDPDRDGIGSAGLLSELGGFAGVRGGARLEPPILALPGKALIETPIGPSAPLTGYLMIVCLPKSGGGWTARPGDAVDEELAERNYVAYAWPDAMTIGLFEAFFVDEHERILVSPNVQGTEPRYAGPNFPPPCDAAFAAATRSEWLPWKGKQPRRELPHDRAVNSAR